MLLLHDGDRVTEVPATLDGGEVVLDGSAVRIATGWELEPHGLCRGDVCRPAALGESVTLTELALLLDRPLAVETGDPSVAVLGEPGGTTTRTGDLAPELSLTDVDGRPVELTRRGRRTLLVAWSTWCGCRHELPAWRTLAGELEPLGLDVVTVALDDDTDRVRHWADKAGVTGVIDPDHRLSDVFGVVNVPSTVWLEDDGTVAKGPTIAPGDDTFVEWTEVDAARHHEALRAWLEGTAPPPVDVPVDDPELRAARAERRLAAWLQRHDREEAARRHYEAAVALAPLDFSIRRASMRDRGEDPFGTEFFALWEEWSAAGRPGYGAT